MKKKATVRRQYKWLSAKEVEALRVDYADDGGYQRRREEYEIRQAKDSCEYDPRLIPAIYCGRRRDGKLYVIDGGLRREVAVRLGVGLWAEIYSTTTREWEAEQFIRWNTQRIVSMSDKIRGSQRPLARLVCSLSESVAAGKLSNQKKNSAARGVGMVTLALAAQICIKAATGKSVTYRRLFEMLDEEKAQRPFDHDWVRRASSAALSNVLDLWDKERIYREPALAVAEATNYTKGQRFNENQLRQLRELPWQTAKVPSGMRVNWNVKRLLEMVEGVIPRPDKKAA